MYFSQKEFYYVFSITEQYPVVSFYFQELLKANSSFLNLVIFVVEWRKCTMIANPTNLERYVLCNVIECIISGNVISHRILLEQVAQKKKIWFSLKFRDLTFAPAKWVCNTVFFAYYFATLIIAQQKQYKTVLCIPLTFLISFSCTRRECY